MAEEGQKDHTLISLDPATYAESTNNPPLFPVPNVSQACEGKTSKAILSTGEAYAFIGITLGILGFLIIPVIFSIAGISFGYLATKNGEGSFGKVAMIVSSASLAVGIGGVIVILTYMDFI